MRKNFCWFVTCAALFVSSVPAQTGGQSDAWLPRSGVVYVAETDSRTAALTQLHGAELHTNGHAGSNFARAQVFKGAQATFELPGLNAAVHVSSTTPVLYVRINADDPELARKRIHLVQLEQVKDSRVAWGYGQNVFGGQRTKKYKDIAITKTDVEEDVWVKVIPNAPLAPGEYAIASMPEDASMFPSVAYDFNVAFAEAKPEKK